MDIYRPQPGSRLCRTLGVLAVAAAVTIGVSGCVGAEDAGTQRSPTTQTAADGGPASPSSSHPDSSPSTSPAVSPTSSRNEQTATALRAIATAEGAVKGGKVFDLEDDTERGKRIWEAKVAAAGGRQFNVVVSQDGRSLISNDEDQTPDDDIRKLQSAKVDLADAINTAASQASGKGDLTAVEIDTHNNTVVWQMEFGDDAGTTVLVDATSGKVLAVGPDVG